MRLDSLLAAIHADPDDLDTRLVYADALSDGGDPRGELIALQCGRGDKPPSMREHELLREHGTAWLGRLAAILDPAYTVFERGFLAAARVRKVPRPMLVATIGSPLWATVTRLAFDTAVGGVVVKNGPFVRGAKVPAAALLLHPIMRSLREVEGIDGDVLLTLCRDGAALPFRSIRASTYPLLERGTDQMWHVNGEARAELEVAEGLPKLRRLELHGYPCNVPDMGWLLRAPVAARLEYVRLENFGGFLDHWISETRDVDPNLAEVVIDYRSVARFRRTVDGMLGDLEINATRLTDLERGQIEASVAMVPAARRPSLRITGTAGNR